MKSMIEIDWKYYFTEHKLWAEISQFSTADVPYSCSYNRWVVTTDLHTHIYYWIPVTRTPYKTGQSICFKKKLPNFRMIFDVVTVCVNGFCVRLLLFQIEKLTRTNKYFNQNQKKIVIFFIFQLEYLLFSNRKSNWEIKTWTIVWV